MRVRFVYGNDYELIESKKEDTENKHYWTVFVRLVDQKQNISKYIRKVSFELDETFDPIINHVIYAPFEHSRLGWGTLNVPITINFRRETGIK